MRLATCLLSDSQSTQLTETVPCVLVEDRVLAIDSLGRSMIDLIANFGTLRDEVIRYVAAAETSQWLALANVRLDAPLRNCEKLICIGKNYADHAREMGGPPPEIPVVFSKFSSTITAPQADVVLPPISQQVDFEAELVVVIGRTGKNIPQDQAFDYVFGYCCGNDISARDWQQGRPGGQWLLGKTFDTFAPLGPWIVTADEVPDPHALDIRMTINGEVLQDANTSDLIFPIDRLISHVSQFVTLRPGDLIFTGTPSGVGAGRTPPRFLVAGDRMEVEIESLGKLENPVVGSAS